MPQILCQYYPLFSLLFPGLNYLIIIPCLLLLPRINITFIYLDLIYLDLYIEPTQQIPTPGNIKNTRKTSKTFFVTFIVDFEQVLAQQEVLRALIHCYVNVLPGQIKLL